MYICDRCINRVDKVLAVTGEVATTPIAVIQQVSEEARTEWCGANAHEPCKPYPFELLVRGLVAPGSPT